MPTTNIRTDGLTPMNQGSSQRSWWDESFSRLLFNAIPLDTEQLVEVDCGVAAAAHSLLPSLPNGRYLGLDFTPERLAEAKKQMAGAHIEPRVDLRLGPATSIPVEDGSCDIVLSIMSLQHNPDVPAVLEEAKRALKPGGRFVAVEPDNLGQRFYFDGVLEEINRVLHALCLKARVAKQPSDIALGPRLPALLREAKFGQIQMRPHMVQSTRNEPASDFFGRLRRIASTTAAEAGLAADDEALGPCEQAINRSQFAGMPKRLGYSSHTVPVFLCVGRTA